MTKHFFDRSEFLDPLGAGLGRRLLLVLGLLFLLPVGKIVLMFHDSCSGGFLEVNGEGFAGAMKFAADGVRGLFGEGGHLLVTHLLVGHEQQ